MKIPIYILLVTTFYLFQTGVFAQTEDKVYMDHIQSVRLFQFGASTDSQLDAPVVSLMGGRELMLYFDDLAYDPDLYTAKLIHCNADWTPSQLKDNDFLLTFNEFNIQNYDYSINTRIPYIHYRFQIPRVTKSGNYVVKVYRGRDESQVILAKRFMVYEDLFTVGAAIVPPSQTADRRESQQLNVFVNYSNGEVMDVLNQVKVMIRQNQRWDNAKYLSKPTFLNDISKTLRYESFDGSNSFRAGNEFRFVDLRFIRATGVNIANVQVETDAVYADAVIDRPRPESVYSQYLDLNGQYLVYTNDRPGGNPEIESEYVLTTFRLSVEEAMSPVFLVGSFTNWGKSPEAKMSWDPTLKLYQTTLLLKQGWYDYIYGVFEGNQFDTNSLEGSYFQTENEYEVLVYFINLGSRYDQLVGYLYLHPTRRRL